MSLNQLLYFLLLSHIRGPFFSCSAGQLHNKLRMEAKERGEEYKVTKLRRNIEMDEYDLVHWRRSFEEREALLRDISWYSHYISILNIRYLTVSLTSLLLASLHHVMVYTNLAFNSNMTAINLRFPTFYILGCG
jgi:hypothetical protein